MNDSDVWPKIDGVDAVNMVKTLDEFVQKSSNLRTNLRFVLDLFCHFLTSTVLF